MALWFELKKNRFFSSKMRLLSGEKVENGLCVSVCEVVCWLFVEINSTDRRLLPCPGRKGDGRFAVHSTRGFRRNSSVRELTQGDSLSAQRRAQCAGRARTGSERGDRDESLPESTTTHRARVD